MEEAGSLIGSQLHLDSWRGERENWFKFFEGCVMVDEGGERLSHTTQRVVNEDGWFSGAAGFPTDKAATILAAIKDYNEIASKQEGVYSSKQPGAEAIFEERRVELLNLSRRIQETVEELCFDQDKWSELSPEQRAEFTRLLPSAEYHPKNDITGLPGNLIEYYRRYGVLRKLQGQ